MKENILPSYLPAASVTFTPKDGGEPITFFRPYEALKLAELEAHAGQNECGALLQLGRRYFSGILGAEQDYEKAYGYLNRAAELGAQDAQYLLANYYINPEITFVQNDPQKCVELLTLAAENGSYRAMEKLAQAYRTGAAELPPDPALAYQWSLQAERMVRIYWDFYAQPNFVDFGETQKEILHAHTRISFDLAAYHANGLGTKRDLNAAIQAIENGERFVCRITGLAKVPMFEERRKQLQAQMQKDVTCAEQAAQDKK